MPKCNEVLITKKCIHSEILMSMPREPQMLYFRKCLFAYITLLVAIIYTIIPYTFQNTQNISYNYRITHKSSEGLSAYTKFTGKQFLVINRDPFDWVDVTVEINTESAENRPSSKLMENGDLTFAVPRIRAGGNYTLETGQLTANAPAGTQMLTAQAYQLRILGTTPSGRSSWDGRWE